jgi:hypothetical protein
VSVGPFNHTPGGGGVGGGDWAAATPDHGSRLGIRVTTARKSQQIQRPGNIHSFHSIAVGSLPALCSSLLSRPVPQPGLSACQ